MIPPHIPSPYGADLSQLPRRVQVIFAAVSIAALAAGAYLARTVDDKKAMPPPDVRQKAPAPSK